MATANYNVNLRDKPQLQGSQVLTVIPFDTSFAAFGPSPDRAWWLVRYEDKEGWVSAQFIRLTRACQSLPPRRP
ncbi:MAG: SH3 domain-containing protein [Anaerolineae bacterium]|nr:SH3 domain-containing protein [Anaerolineae bacterium]